MGGGVLAGKLNTLPWAFEIGLNEVFFFFRDRSVRLKNQNLIYRDERLIEACLRRRRENTFFLVGLTCGKCWMRFKIDVFLNINKNALLINLQSVFMGF